MSDKQASKQTAVGTKRRKVVRKAEKKAAPAPKSWRIAFLLSLFLGFVGADRFYIGRTRSAIIKLLIVGGYGVWWITDLVLIASDWRKDAWGRPLKH